MKNLKKYFEDLFATPCNTTGMKKKKKEKT